MAKTELTITSRLLRVNIAAMITDVRAHERKQEPALQNGDHIAQEAAEEGSVLRVGPEITPPCPDPHTAPKATKGISVVPGR